MPIIPKIVLWMTGIAIVAGAIWYIVLRVSSGAIGKQKEAVKKIKDKRKENKKAAEKAEKEGKDANEKAHEGIDGTIADHGAGMLDSADDKPPEV